MNNHTEKMGHLIRKAIDKIDKKTDVILFGSRARGDAKIDSDWDILLLTDYPVDLQKERVFRDELYDLELETGESLSLFVFSKNDWQNKQNVTSFFYNVNLDGIRL